MTKEQLEERKAEVAKQIQDAARQSQEIAEKSRHLGIMIEQGRGFIAAIDEILASISATKSTEPQEEKPSE